MSTFLTVTARAFAADMTSGCIMSSLFDLKTDRYNVSIDDLATHYGVSRTTIKSWVKRDIIQPTVRIGNVVRFNLADCDRRLHAASRRK